jgi:hypothetical protein
MGVVETFPDYRLNQAPLETWLKQKFPGQQLRIKVSVNQDLGSRVVPLTRFGRRRMANMNSKSLGN